MIELEICVDSLESAMAAESGGAQRIELCSALREGGLTPSSGLIRAVRKRVKLGVHVMVRPRGGDFLYSNDELAVMQNDIVQLKEFGVDGVVLGLLTSEGYIDVVNTRELVEIARPMQVTFHRAIDMSRDLSEAVERVVSAGVDRVLTSGGEATAIQGLQQIAEMTKVAAGRVQIMVGGGVRPDNVEQIAQAADVNAIHAALRTARPSLMLHRNVSVPLGEPGLDEYVRYVVLTDNVKELSRALEKIDKTGRGGCAGNC